MEGGSWLRLKQSGLPALLVLPAFAWLAFCCSVLHAFALPLLVAGRRQEYYAVSTALFQLTHRPILYLFEYSGSRIFLHGDAAKMGKTIGFNQALILANHRGDVDWLLGLQILDFGGGLECCKAITKKSLLVVPFFGFIWWCVDFVFLSRNWKTDSGTLDQGYKQQHLYREHGVPYALTLFPEGTRKTAKKLLEAQEFSKSRSLPVFNHLLCPRAKGLWSAVNGLKLDAVYDVTLVEKNGEANVVTLAQGVPSEMHVYMEQLAPDVVPKEEDKLSSWLFGRWELKEKQLQRFSEGKALVESSSTPVELRVRDSALRTLLGAVVWWALCCLLFFRWCLQTGRWFLLGGCFIGSVLVVAACGFALHAVHFKKDGGKKKST